MGKRVNGNSGVIVSKMVDWDRVMELKPIMQVALVLNTGGLTGKPLVWIAMGWWGP